MRQTIKAVVGIGVALVAMFGFASAASAYPPGPEGTLTFEFPSQVSSGGEINITGTCDAGDEVTFAIGDETLGTAAVDENDEFSETFDVPDLDPGTFAITATCGDLVAEGDIEVLGADEEPPPGGGTGGTGTGGGPLARTGFNALPVVTLGAAALVLGGAAVYGSKRRRATI